MEIHMGKYRAYARHRKFAFFTLRRRGVRPYRAQEFYKSIPEKSLIFIF
jgi:hypothetical protein